MLNNRLGKRRKMNFIRQHILPALVAPAMMFGGAIALAQDNEGALAQDNEGAFAPELARELAPTQALQEGLGVAILSAVVDADGTLDRGSGVLSATNVNPGSYEVIFRRNVRQCTYVATIGIPGSVGTAVPGEINVAGASVSTSGVFVDIQDSAGFDVNHPFHLIVFCHK